MHKRQKLATRVPVRLLHSAALGYCSETESVTHWVKSDRFVHYFQSGLKYGFYKKPVAKQTCWTVFSSQKLAMGVPVRLLHSSALGYCTETESITHWVKSDRCALFTVKVRSRLHKCIKISANFKTILSYYIVVAVTLSEILKAKQKLGITFNSIFKLQFRNPVLFLNILCRFIICP